MRTMRFVSSALLGILSLLMVVTLVIHVSKGMWLAAATSLLLAVFCVDYSESQLRKAMS